MQTLDSAEYSALDATAMANLVRVGEVAADELRAAATAQHEATTETINAIVEWYEQPDPVSVEGKAGPLAGVPFLRKDYGSTEAGRLVEMGSLLAAGHTATESSEYFDRIKAAGAQVLGRSAVPELIQHGSTESRATGATRNPHDPTLSAGGSSGGAGAAVAAGVVPAAHASDCAGSIRIPAAVCGLFGLKPTRRAVPWRGGGWGGLAEEFVVTRTLRDAALFWEVLSGRGLDSRQRPAGLRVALSLDHWAGATPDALVVGATQAAALRLEEQGHRVEVVAQPVDNDELMSTWHPLFSRWVGRNVDSLEAVTGRAAGPETLEPLTLLLLDEVRRLTVDDISDAQVAQGRITRRLEVAMTSFDVLITPTLGRPTIPLETMAGEVESMEDYLRLNDETFPYNYLFNVVGWPAFSVPWPVPTSEEGENHPLGVQLIGRPGSEPQLLALAEQLS